MQAYEFSRLYPSAAQHETTVAAETGDRCRTPRAIALPASRKIYLDPWCLSAFVHWCEYLKLMDPAVTLPVPTMSPVSEGTTSRTVIEVEISSRFPELGKEFFVERGAQVADTF
jgi:hypothetical protein